MINMKNVFTAVLCAGAFVTTFNAHAASEVVNCLNRNGGYLTSVAKLTQNDDNTVTIDLQRFSPLASAIGKYEFKFGNEMVKKITFTVPRDHCQFKTAQSVDATLFYCSTNLSQISADLVLADGSTKKVELSPNSKVSSRVQIIETLATLDHTLVVELAIGQLHPEDNGIIGFQVGRGSLSQCQ